MHNGLHRERIVPDQGDQPERFSKLIGRLVGPESPFVRDITRGTISVSENILMPYEQSNVPADTLSVRHMSVELDIRPGIKRLRLTHLDDAKGIEMQQVHDGPITALYVTAGTETIPVQLTERSIFQRLNAFESGLSILPKHKPA